MRYRNKWALKSRGHAAVDAANLHPDTALVFSRNSRGAASRAAPLVESEHLARASSSLDSPFEDPPSSEGSEQEGEGRSGRLRLARGQLVASGTDPDLALLSRPSMPHMPDVCAADHDDMTEALRQSEWTAAEAARVAAAEEARDQEEMRRAEAASRSEAMGDDDDDELRRAYAESLTSSRVRCALYAYCMHTQCTNSTHPYSLLLTLGVPHAQPCEDVAGARRGGPRARQGRQPAGERRRRRGGGGGASPRAAAEQRVSSLRPVRGGY